MITIVWLAYAVPMTAAQSTEQNSHQHDAVAAPQPADAPAQHDMAQMTHGDAMPASREGSGTSWLPDESPMYAFHRELAGWMIMAHGNAFVQYLHETGDRGSEQAGSINWAMVTGGRSVGRGRLTLRGMLSLEPWTIAGCGYPDLLASGETCGGEAIHDRQHPHDLFMELAASYDRPLAGDIRLQVYGGPAGEPALGPTAFPHRLSAMANPLAPITHHWFDATHITYGVVTAGVYGSSWKAETSVFNGREPDEHRANLELAALDSWSGRVWFLPTKQWALQASAGHLTEAEAGHDGQPRVDVTRVTATATHHRRVRPGAFWASTVGWGHNGEPGNHATNALLAETTLTLADRDAWFGRFELSGKSSHDLDLPDAASNEGFTIAKLQAGYTRYFADWNGFKPGVGAGISAGIVPESLTPHYGSRINVGFGIFVTLRPKETGM